MFHNLSPRNSASSLCISPRNFYIRLRGVRGEDAENHGDKKFSQKYKKSAKIRLICVICVLSKLLVRPQRFYRLYLCSLPCGIPRA